MATEEKEDPAQSGQEVEICDGPTPDDTSVLMERAHQSGPLSHLCSLGLVTVQMLKESAEARAVDAPAFFREAACHHALPNALTSPFRLG
ncbi:hypothetical protein [Streptomyces atratus]|uniref:hypothetical protein n=1 Tax=Streptomyces atratus TaxID=1893 RepID=UPI0018E54D23|nr:hypothetical protein [Streptomyces atratus]